MRNDKIVWALSPLDIKYSNDTQDRNENEQQKKMCSKRIKND